MLRNISITLIVVAALASSMSADPRARITLVNLDAPGVGLNDPTPAEPTGGNPGTTIGEQRQIALAYAASLWARNLRSFVPIRIQASFRTRPCSATGAVLASAGPVTFFSGFSKWQTHPDTFYPVALANKLARQDIRPDLNDITALFNIDLGQPGCLTGVPFYYGLDGDEGPNGIDLVATALHEFGHGLGVVNGVNINPASPNFGQLLGFGPDFQGLPDVYMRNLFDTTIGRTWDQMTVAERQQSIPNGRKVVWIGDHVTRAVPDTLAFGLPLLSIGAPAALVGQYDVGPATFGAPLTAPGLTAAVVVANDAADATGPSPTDGCSAITNAAAVAGKLALVDRGACTFVVKVANLQAAGAIGVLVADNAPDTPPAPLGGSDPSLVIPAARILRVDGDAIKAQLAQGVTVSVTLGLDMTRRAGANENGFAQVNATNPVAPGSSISHWDPIARPNLLMEPAINGDLNHTLDLTLPLLWDIGWLDEENRR